MQLPGWLPGWATPTDVAMAAAAVVSLALAAWLWIRMAGAQLAAQTETFLAAQAQR